MVGKLHRSSAEREKGTRGQPTVSAVAGRGLTTKYSVELV